MIFKKFIYKKINSTNDIAIKKIKKKISIKLPNDLLLNNKKICGILQETIVYNNSLFLVLGIGINLIKNPKIINYPTTNILDEVRINVSKKLIIKHIINEFKYN